MSFGHYDPHSGLGIRDGRRVFVTIGGAKPADKPAPTVTAKFNPEPEPKPTFTGSVTLTLPSKEAAKLRALLSMTTRDTLNDVYKALGAALTEAKQPWVGLSIPAGRIDMRGGRFRTADGVEV